MKTSNGDIGEDARLGLAAAVYYAVMLVAFAIGLYGLFSLFWLASAEIQHKAYVLGSLF